MDRAYANDIPCAALQVIVFVGFVTSDADHVLGQELGEFVFRVAFFAVRRKDHFTCVVRPRGETHFTFLRVEREEFHIDTTRRFVDGRRDPLHFARMHENDFGFEGHLVVSIYSDRRRR